MNDYNTPPRNDANLPPRSDYRETRVVRTSSGGSGWLIAGIAAALLVVGALWLTAAPDGETQLTTDERPAVTDQTTIPGQTDNAPTSSITEEPAPAQVAVGSNMIYAGVHQTGATIKPKAGGALTFTLANGETVIAGSVTIPARPYLGISDEEREDIEDLSVGYFAELLSGEAR